MLRKKDVWIFVWISLNSLQLLLCPLVFYIFRSNMRVEVAAFLLMLGSFLRIFNCINIPINIVLLFKLFCRSLKNKISNVKMVMFTIFFSINILIIIGYVIIYFYFTRDTANSILSGAV